MKNQFWKIFALIAIVAIGASVVYANHASKQANEGVTITPHIKGNEAATVKLVEYSDFQCPACEQFAPIIKGVMEKYGDQMSFEYKHFPLISVHPFAVPAAKAAEAAAQQGKFFEMHDMLFENQAVWSKSANPTRFFIQYAEEIGLDTAVFKEHMKSSLIEDSVAASFTTARDLGLVSTPSFFLNGQRLEFTTLDEFTGKIEAALGIVPPGATSTPMAEPSVQFGL